MRTNFPGLVKNYVSNFLQAYTLYKAEVDKNIRYKIISTFESYKKTNKIELSLTDKPGDILPPLDIYEIKNTKDILASMHPIDVNTINDLYYLARDSLSELKVDGQHIKTIDIYGNQTEYDINHEVDFNKIHNPRVSYMLGYIQAENLIRKTYQSSEQYKIIEDHLATLKVEDTFSDKQILKCPQDILFSGDYKLYSKEDVAKIGFICGQMSRL